jgi:dihydropyrimidinase
VTATELDLAVVGGLVAFEDGTAHTDIGIANGRIALVAAPGALPPATNVVDATGAIVFPGGIDPHVHTRWPFLEATTCDSFRDSTRGALYGGTTTIIDSVIRRSPQSALDAIARRRADADPDVLVDYALHCAIGDPDDFDTSGIGLAVDAGVGAFKLYMTYRARGIMADDALILRAMEEAARVGAVVKVHAENGVIADANVSRFYADGHTDPTWFPRSKPDWVEAEAIQRAAFFAARAGVRLYIVHVSSALGLDEVLRARRDGVTVYAETCPQYLVLDDSVFARPDGHRFLCSPPIRTTADAAALWEAIANGGIDTVGSDHCLFMTGQKDAHHDDFAAVPNGLPGVETRLPILFSEGHVRRGIPLERITQVGAANAARIFGLYPRKGALRPGGDADLAVIDPGARRTVTAASLHMGSDWTPFEGLDVTGWPRTVIAGGRVLLDDDGLHGERGIGHYLLAGRPVEPLRIER